MRVFDFIRDFETEDLYDADKRNQLEKVTILLARMVFDGLYEEDLSETPTIVNHYELALEKLKTPIGAEL